MSTGLIYEPSGRAREYAPLALNLYNGCPHGCTYCYAPAATHKDAATFHGRPVVRADVIAKLERELARGVEVGMQYPDGRHDPVLLCFTTDPYQPLAAETGTTRRAIDLLHGYGYPVHILTKAGERAGADFDLLTDNPGDAFAASLTFTNYKDSKAWEPFAASPVDRLLNLRQAHALGIKTWASLEPVIDPAQSLELVRMTHEYVDLFKVGTLNHHAHARTIDWPKFARDVVDLLESLGAAYYLKNDLRAYLR